MTSSTVVLPQLGRYGASPTATTQSVGRGLTGDVELQGSVAASAGCTGDLSGRTPRGAATPQRSSGTAPQARPRRRRTVAGPLEQACSRLLLAPSSDAREPQESPGRCLRNSVHNSGAARPSSLVDGPMPDPPSGPAKVSGVLCGSTPSSEAVRVSKQRRAWRGDQVPPDAADSSDR